MKYSLSLILAFVFSVAAFADKGDVDADRIRSTDRTKTYTFPSASDELLGKTNPSITGSITSNHITTPSNPAAGFLKLYTKSDNKLYKLTSDGTESAVGGGAASEVTFTPAGTLIADDVQEALEELDTDLQAHLSDTIGAHAASAISFTPGSVLLGTTVQSALTQTNDIFADVASDGGFVTLNGAETITAKIYDGGTASNSSRLIVPKHAKATLDSQSRAEGVLVYATDLDKLYVDDGTNLQPVGSGGSGGGVNILQNSNPDFEQGVGSWTESGGTEAAATTTNILFDLGGATWDSNSASQTYCSALVAVPEWLKGNNAEAYIWTKVPSGTSTHKIRVTDGTNTIREENIISTTYAKKQSVTFVSPSSGSLQVCLVSVNSNEPLIAADKGFVGESVTREVAQARLAGEAYIAGTASCAWGAGTTTTPSAFTADTDCPGPTVVSSPMGTWSTTDTNLPQFTVASLPPGIYKAKFTAYVLQGASGRSVLAINDGTTTCEPIGVNQFSTGRVSQDVECSFTYTTAQSSRTFSLYGANTDAVTFQVTHTDTAPRTSLKFILEYFPTSAQTVVSPEMENWKVDANIAGDNPDMGTSDQASPVGIFNGNLTLTNNTVKNAIPAQIPCSSTNAPSGTTCSAGTESIGVSFPLPAAGVIEACVSFSHSAIAAIGANATATFMIVETASNAQTPLQIGATKPSSGSATTTIASNGTHPHRLCTDFGFDSAGTKTLRLMYEQDLTGTATFNGLIADGSAAHGARDVHWEIRPKTQAVPVPYFVGGVISNSTGVERIERAFITNSGTPVVTRQSGTWISSITDNGTGDITLNLVAGLFSSPPSCAFMPNGTVQNRINGSVTTTSVPNIQTFNSSTVANDANLDIICVGAK